MRRRVVGLSSRRETNSGNTSLKWENICVSRSQHLSNGGDDGCADMVGQYRVVARLYLRLHVWLGVHVSDSTQVKERVRTSSPR